MAWPSISNIVYELPMGLESFLRVKAYSIQKLLRLVLAAPLKTLL
jgi:hypothetical protein